MKKQFAILFFALVLTLCASVPARACEPIPALMGGACYSSCANQALYYYDQCKSDCVRNYCTQQGNNYTCSPYFYSCQGICENMKCLNLAECEDYCHEW